MESIHNSGLPGTYTITWSKVFNAGKSGIKSSGRLTRSNAASAGMPAARNMLISKRRLVLAVAELPRQRLPRPSGARSPSHGD